MPSHCESMGPGWTTVNGQCVYSPTALDTGAQPAGEFEGTISSLGFEENLAGSTLADPADHEKYFDPYSTAEEERFTTAATTDISQLGEAWGLAGEQLGKTWGLKRGELGWGAGMGLREARRAGIGAKRKSRMAFSGTAEEMQRTAESNVMSKYAIGMEAGKSAYEQAMETGQLGLEQGTTDIYQGLESNVLGERKDWQKEQRVTLNMMLGKDIWEDPNKPEQKSASQKKNDCERGCNKTAFPWICKLSC